MSIPLRHVSHPTHTTPLPEDDRVSESHRRRVRDALIGALAVIGTLTVAWVAISWLLSLSVIVSASGASASAMPAGSAAVVHRVPADQVRVGDLIAVTTATGAHSNTRQVVAVGEVSEPPGSRSLSLRREEGNPGQVDGYLATEVDVVIASAPHVGRVLSWINRPVVVMCLGAVVACAVIWVLLPPRGPRESGAAS